MTALATEVQQGQRFEFGENWQPFLRVLNDDRIAEAERSLRRMLELESLTGKSFVDIGSGSGLFSLAAMRLGAAKVYSFDCDPCSVACTWELKRRYHPEADRWIIEEGNILDQVYLARLGQFDIVYSWGVLHHTGNMWQALEHIVPMVRSGGRLFIAIYNDQGGASRRWRVVKSLYNRGVAWRLLIAACFIPYFVLGGLAVDILRGQNPLVRYRDYKQSRGMSRIHDWVDWLGGYPFEVAKPEAVFEFYSKRGFKLLKLKTCGGGLGNNEYVFMRCAA
jgi:2-polyprenyl-6-hydroxyphenyl methylase/3-demethylubiquinone-9 3-methyltransferase